MLNDVWLSISQEVGFYYEATFDHVPVSAGVYAWFYPLRLLSREPKALHKFAQDVQTLYNYEPSLEGPPSPEADVFLAWSRWRLAASRMPKPLQLSATLEKTWGEVAANDLRFLDFQQALLKSSVLMPPLYVGKADNLNLRCAQHLRGQAGNDFHRRFEAVARRCDLQIRAVRELIFACIRTGPATDQNDTDVAAPVHELLESLLKSTCAPPYGMR